MGETKKVVVDTDKISTIWEKHNTNLDCHTHDITRTVSIITSTNNTTRIFYGIAICKLAGSDLEGTSTVITTNQNI